MCITFTVMGAMICYQASRVEVENNNGAFGEITRDYKDKLHISEEKQSECRDYLVMIREKGMDLYWKNIKE